MEKPALLVSRCLLGDSCRYDGKSKPNAAVMNLAREFRLIPVCPEVDGGLSIPRPPAERVSEGVVNIEGRDVTDAYRRGAEHALALARRHGAVGAVLKLRSPACGKGQIYDGTFTGTLTDGDGVCAELLLQNGIPVWGETEVTEDGCLPVHPFKREGGETLV